MALTNFVPEVWSKKLNIKLRRYLVGLSIVNQDYIGEIKAAGDTLKINRPAAITTGTYVPGTPIDIQTPTSSTLDLDIDQLKYFAFKIDDVRTVQANVGLSKPYIEEATEAMGILVDEFIFGKYTAADSSNVIAKTTLSKSNIYDRFNTAAQNMDENNVPAMGRWMVLSPVEAGLLRGSDDFTSASELGDEVKKTGLVGQVLGFNVYMSNSLTSASDGSNVVRHCPYGHNMAITFGFQFTELESSRMEKEFADLVKGLTIYGAKVIKPLALGDLRNTVS